MSELHLPPHYTFERTEPDAPRLFRPNGTVLATFGPNWSAHEVEKAAWENHRKVEAAIREAEKLLGREGGGS